MLRVCRVGFVVRCSGLLIDASFGGRIKIKETEYYLLARAMHFKRAKLICSFGVLTQTTEKEVASCF